MLIDWTIAIGIVGVVACISMCAGLLLGQWHSI